MNGNLLLAWMSHLGEGSWSGFRRAVSELEPDASDLLALARRLRIGLSDLAYADFFITGSQRWQILPPTMAGLAARDSGTVLCGALTPKLVSLLRSTAPEYGLDLEISELIDLPSRILIRGPWHSAESLGRRFGFNCFAQAAMQMLASTELVSSRLEHAQEEPAPTNWDVLSFDFEKLDWVPGLLPQAACEFIPHYGPSKFCFHRRHGRIYAMPKRDAVYFSAMLQSVKLLIYDPECNRLSAPIAAPLPERLARAACLCSGALPQVNNGRFEYNGVLLEIASALLVAAGQPHVIAQELAQTRRGSLG